MKRSSICAAAAVGLLALTGSGATGSSSTSVDFGAISHQGLKDLGPASTGLKLSLELGLTTSPWVLAAGDTNLTLTSANAIESSGVWNDTKYPKPYTETAAGGGGASVLEDRPGGSPRSPRRRPTGWFRTSRRSRMRAPAT
jgi:hypothetical protein